MTSSVAQPGLDVERVRQLLADQDGVVTRSQVLDCGGRPHDIARYVRRRELAPLLPGVYVSHTGRPTWQERAWAGVLFYWPAALAGRSAARSVAGPGLRDPEGRDVVEIAVAHDRRVRRVSGYRVRRIRALDDQVHWGRHPPSQRIEEAVIDLAERAGSDLDAIAVLAEACRGRRTTAPRLLGRLQVRSRVARRAWLTGVLEDVASGACSVLEQGYLDRVERAHGLPTGRRQPPGLLHGRPMFRDVLYELLAFVVELDGRLFHDSTRQRDHDLDRDLETAVGGAETVRLGWGQVFERSCWTAGKLSVILQRHGWDGVPIRCGPHCRLPRE